MKTKGKQNHLVVFEPSGRRGRINEGKTILEAAQELGVDLQNVCGGQAQCGKCKVQIIEGNQQEYGIDSKVENLSPIEENESKILSHLNPSKGWRLACQASIYGDVVVFVPEESQAGGQVIAKLLKEREIELKPAVKKYALNLTPADLNDPMADWERLENALNETYGLKHLKVDYHVLRKLQDLMRQGKWHVTVSVWMDREVIHFEPGFVEKAFGLAVDIGTTTIAVYLCDLNSGEVQAVQSMVNPQVVYGEDVISRITYAMTQSNGLDTLHHVVVRGINQIIQKISHQAGIHEQDIVDMVCVGNTCMHHLFLDVNPEYLGRSPFVPAVHCPINIKARDMGIRISPGAYVHLLPIIAGFVGSDTVGVMLAEEPYRREETGLIIDVGTNGELILGNRDRLICASCATGPAFEGATIKHGMRAAAGAIESISIDPDTKEVSFMIIDKKKVGRKRGGGKALGICGSGIIDGVAQMVSAGIVDKTGRIDSKINSPRLIVTGEGPAFVIAWEHETKSHQEIVITQGDVRAIQMAKGALYAGSRLLMEKLGIERLDKIILAGAFGSYINKKSAATLGMFPDCPLEKVQAVGNAAGDGARIALLNTDKRKEANLVAREVEYLELTTSPDFQNEFVNAMHFPHMNDTLSYL